MYNSLCVQWGWDCGIGSATIEGIILIITEWAVFYVWLLWPGRKNDN